MKKYQVIVSLFAFAMMFFISSAISFANENQHVVQAYMNDDKLKIILTEQLTEGDTSVRISNQKISDYTTGNFKDANSAVKTTLLVDVSGSVPLYCRENIDEFISMKIKNILPNEEIRIVTFSDEIKIIQDFTHDRYDLVNAANGIIYDGTQSKIYDAVYDTIQNIDSGEKISFFRTILITDGIDYSEQGVLKEELYMYLNEKYYPIYTLRVSDSPNVSEDKPLSALSRISNGGYIEFNSSTNIDKLISEFDVSNYNWIQANVTKELLDGSIRQVDIVSGDRNYSFDLKMSVLKSSNTSESKSDFSENHITSSFDATSVPKSELPDDDSSISSDTILIIVALSVVGIIILFFSVILFIRMRTKKQDIQVERIINSDEEDIGTQILSESISSETSGIIVKISNTKTGENWERQVCSRITIGRSESNSIVIRDTTVSSIQCAIISKQSSLYLLNISKSNITKLNGVNVLSEMLVQPGDKIKMGLVTVEVTQIIGACCNVQKTSRDNEPDEKTEYIF